jgi:hypothetical protein
MTIIVNPHPPPTFIVHGRANASGFAKKTVDLTTGVMSRMAQPLGAWNPLGPVEQGYSPRSSHDTQNTMRAHHVADSQIQQLVCDYLNNQIGMMTMLDRIGVLYLTSWVDVIVTPRIFTIWLQWAGALAHSLAVGTSHFAHLPNAQKASCADRLAKWLSSSIANLRVGDPPTDSALGRAIAPRLQRGQRDVLYYLVGVLSGYNFAQPSLSVETSLASFAWGGHFLNHALAPAGGLVPVGNVFMGPNVGGGILISEQRPLLGNAHAVVPTPQFYPGTQTNGGYIIRATRATTHLVMAVAILLFLYTVMNYVVDGLTEPRDL